MIKLKYNKNLIYFLILILITKLIALFIFPREISFYITGLTKFNYFNTLSMTIDMQSFRDGNHPGTPIYFMESLFLKITESKIDDFYNFFYFNNFLIFLINIFSITNFFNYFKKTMSKFEIISFLLLFFDNALPERHLVQSLCYRVGHLPIYVPSSLGKQC